MKQYKVVVNSDKCKGCELCIHFCPKKVLGVSPEVNNKGYHPAAMLGEGCVGCQSCAMMCPDCCITIYEMEEDEQ